MARRHIRNIWPFCLLDHRRRLLGRECAGGKTRASLQTVMLLTDRPRVLSPPVTDSLPLDSQHRPGVLVVVGLCCFNSGVHFWGIGRGSVEDEARRKRDAMS